MRVPTPCKNFILPWPFYFVNFDSRKTQNREKMNFSEYSVDLAMKVLIKINLPNASKEGQSDLLVDISSLFKLIVKQTRPGTEHPTPLTLASKSRLVCPLYATRRRGTPGLRGTFITYTSCLVRGRILCCFVRDSDLMLMHFCISIAPPRIAQKRVREVSGRTLGL